MGDGVVIIGGSIKEVRNRFKGCSCHSTLSAGKAPFFKSSLNGSGGDDEPLVGKPVG